MLCLVLKNHLELKELKLKLIVGRIALEDAITHLVISSEG